MMKPRLLPLSWATWSRSAVCLALMAAPCVGMAGKLSIDDATPASTPSAGLALGGGLDRLAAVPGTLQINGLDLVTGAPSSARSPSASSVNARPTTDTRRSANAAAASALSVGCATLLASGGKARTQGSGTGTHCW